MKSRGHDSGVYGWAKSLRLMPCDYTIIKRIFLSESRGIKLGKAVGVYSLLNRRPMCWVCDRTAVTCRE